jgi:aspartyl-tRNA(Asn)/glutamyl-tRNA(Gln) amidotransferase subunit B
MSQRALDYEIKRQQYILEGGESVVQENRLWDDSRGDAPHAAARKRPMITATSPDPDLVAVKISADWVEAVLRNSPNCPGKARTLRAGLRHPALRCRRSVFEPSPGRLL